MEDGPGRDDLAADAELLVGERREEAEQLDDVQVARVLAEDELQHRKAERDGESLEDLRRRRDGDKAAGLWATSGATQSVDSQTAGLPRTARQ